MSNIDQSLDDIIKTNKSGRGGRRARKGGPKAASGPIRTATNRLGTRHTPYSIGKSARRNSSNSEGAWQHDLFEGAGAGAGGFRGGKPVGIETGTKLYISNLDHGVSTDDIKELFSEVGDLKRCDVNYDRSGRSKGTAEVVFARKYDAQVAMKRYNNVQLDGKPMKIECIGTNVVTAVAKGRPAPAAAAPVPSGSTRTKGAFKRFGRRKTGGGAGGGGRRAAGPAKTPKSAQELDADLDNYHSTHAEAMQTN